MTKPQQFNILIADDHPLFRESLAAMLLRIQAKNHALPVVLQAEDAFSCLEHVKNEPSIQLILTDLDMPGMDGLALLQQLTTLLPDTPIVMISGSENHADIHQALKLGAKGFIPKSSSTPILLAALQLILVGGTYLPPSLLAHQPPASINQQERNGLTERQKEILIFLKQGLQNKVIAHALDLSESTVKVHVRGVFSVLGVKNRTQAVQKAQEMGIL